MRFKKQIELKEGKHIYDIFMEALTKHELVFVKKVACNKLTFRKLYKYCDNNGTYCLKRGVYRQRIINLYIKIIRRNFECDSGYEIWDDLLAKLEQKIKTTDKFYLMGYPIAILNSIKNNIFYIYM